MQQQQQQQKQKQQPQQQRQKHNNNNNSKNGNKMHQWKMVPQILLQQHLEGMTKRALNSRLSGTNL
jgi:hypothetical protein